MRQPITNVPKDIYFPQKSLLPGDLVFTMPLHSVGLVIASVDEIPWGHVGIMRDRKNVIEACPGGVRIVNISDYAKNVEYVNHIDVFRPISADGNGFDKDSIKRMRAFLDQCIGVQFPVLTMFPLYFIQKMRMQISSSSLRNSYLSFASALLKFSKEGAMCSEFVMQALRKLEPNDRNWPRLLDRCPELLSGGLTLSNRDFIQGAKHALGVLAPKLISMPKFLASTEYKTRILKSREDVFKKLPLLNKQKLLSSKLNDRLILVGDLFFSPDFKYLGSIKMSQPKD